MERDSKLGAKKMAIQVKGEEKEEKKGLSSRTDCGCKSHGLLADLP